MTFYVHTGNGAPTGPWALEHLARAVLDGQVPPSALIATYGEAEWRPANARPDLLEAVSNLRAQRSSVPAPPPPAAPAPAASAPPAPKPATAPASAAPPAPSPAPAPAAKPAGATVAAAKAATAAPLKVDDPIANRLALGIFAGFFFITFVQLVVIAVRSDADAAKPAAAQTQAAAKRPAN